MGSIACVRSKWNHIGTEPMAESAPLLRNPKHQFGFRPFLGTWAGTKGAVWTEGCLRTEPESSFPTPIKEPGGTSLRPPPSVSISSDRITAVAKDRTNHRDPGATARLYTNHSDPGRGR